MVLEVASVAVYSSMSTRSAAARAGNEVVGVRERGLHDGGLHAAVLRRPGSVVVSPRVEGWGGRGDCECACEVGRGWSVGWLPLTFSGRVR